MILGLDIGTYSVKIVLLDKKGINVVSFGEECIINKINQFDIEKINRSHWVAAFQKLVSKLSINLKKVDMIASSISGSKVSIKSITTLEIEESELINILNLEAKKHIPLDGSDAVIDYHILGPNIKEIDKVDLLLVATTQKIIKVQDKIMKSCKITDAIFDTDPIAMLNSYQYNYDCPNNEVDVLLNIGFLTSTLIVTSKNEELFTREIDIGGHKINLEIMNLKNVSYKEAEIEKNQKGISVFNSDSENDESEIQISTRNIYSELSDEIRKTLRYYMKSKNSISYNNFYISGGMSETPGLIKFLNESLNVDFLIFNPFLKVNKSKKVVNSAKYSVALGLALRGTLIDNSKKKRSLPFNGISTKIKDFLINSIKE